LIDPWSVRRQCGELVPQGLVSHAQRLFARPVSQLPAAVEVPGPPGPHRFKRLGHRHLSRPDRRRAGPVLPGRRRIRGRAGWGRPWYGVTPFPV